MREVFLEDTHWIVRSAEVPLKTEVQRVFIGGGADTQQQGAPASDGAEAVNLNISAKCLALERVGPHSRQKRTGGIVPGYGACLIHTKPWVPYPVLHTKKKIRKETQ